MNRSSKEDWTWSLLHELRLRMFLTHSLSAIFFLPARGWESFATKLKTVKANEEASYCTCQVLSKAHLIAYSALLQICAYLFTVHIGGN